MSRPARSATNTAILLPLVAFALRLIRLDYRALWWDEGRNIFFAVADWATASQIAVRSGDVNPPIYRLLLGGWMELSGSSPFAVRLLSVFFGVLTVVFVYRLAVILYSERVGIIAGALAAVAPPLVYYSQEAKGYSLVTMGTICAAWIWLRLHRQSHVAPGASMWVWFGISTLLAVGSHYFALLFLLVQNLWTVIWLGDNAGIRAKVRVWQHIAKWVIVQILVMAPLIVYAAWSIEALMGHSVNTFFGVRVPVWPRLPDMARWGATSVAEWSNPAMQLLYFLREFGYEIVGGPAAVPVVASAAGIVLIVLLVASWRECASSGFHRANWVLWLGVPLLLSALFSLRFSYFFPRFLIFILPGVLILAAFGVERLWRCSRAAAMPLGLLLVGLWTVTLAGHYVAPSDPDEDWRGLAQRFGRLQQRGDLAVYSYDWIQGYLQSYLLPTAQPDYLFFSSRDLDVLTQVARSHSRVWFLDYQTTPFAFGNRAGEWMREYYGIAASETFGYARLTLFARPSSAIAFGKSVKFSNGIGLRWRGLTNQAIPGDVLALEIMWRAPLEPVDAYQVFMHLMDENGVLWVGRDGGPVNDLRPTVSWQRAESVRSQHALLLPLDLPDGEYQLHVGMYSLEHGTRLLTSAGDDSVLIGLVRVSLP